MQERRQFVRLDMRVEVTYTVLPATQGTRSVTKNIGGGGICFYADEVVPPGTLVQVVMRIPDRELPVTFTGEVIWSERYEVISKGVHRRAGEVGVQFVNIDEEDQQALVEHVLSSLQPPSQ